MELPPPYMTSVKKVPEILAAMQRAAVPDGFGREFLNDLGFTSSTDRSVIRFLKYIGFLDQAGRPQALYREYMDQSRAKSVLGQALRTAFDDLFKSDREAYRKSVSDLKGWFKSKTGASEGVAEDIASTFAAFAGLADFSGGTAIEPSDLEDNEEEETESKEPGPIQKQRESNSKKATELGLVYRFEIHLPDTQNVDTYRAIFRAIREEL
jgi:hypothetical protein